MNQSPLVTPPEAPAPATGWGQAVAAWMEARLELIQIESREASRLALRKGILAGAVGASVFFVWSLLLAGGTGWLAAYLERSGHPWGWPVVALAFAGLHALLAGGLLLALRRPNPRPFPITRNEFEKDREWIKTLQSPRD